MPPPGFCTRRQTFLFQIPQRKDPASELPGRLHNRLPVRTQTLYQQHLFLQGGTDRIPDYGKKEKTSYRS